ncbi:hypothetical protein EES43_13640 [Streptomyces sp. ADI96-02]|nr:hypothetical protein EES43_13640 [Streptomyces sp. ADI96-02]
MDGFLIAFLIAALEFPTVIFGAALVVVLCFWLLVLTGAVDQRSFDADLDTRAAGLGGVPVAVSVSLIVVLAWFGSLGGSLLLLWTGVTGTVRAALAVTVLAGALLLAWWAVRLLVRGIRRYGLAAHRASRGRTGRRRGSRRPGPRTASAGPVPPTRTTRSRS